MARKPDIKKRREIALRALEVIRERGIHRITMSELAIALKMKRPTLYWYFRNLGQILDAIIDETYRELGEVVAKHLQSFEHPLDTLEGLLEVNMAFIRQHSDRILVMVQLWAVTSAEDPERAVARGREYMTQLRVHLVSLLEAGIAKGNILPCNAAGVVDLVLSIVDGAMIQHIVHGIDLDRLVGSVRFLLSSLRNREIPKP